MVTTTISCDRCQSEIRESRTLLDVATGPLRPHRQCIDLCVACSADLVSWLKSGPAGLTLKAS